MWKALNFHGGFIEAKSNFWGLYWTFSPTEHENIGSRLAKGWHAEVALPREAHRATSKDVRANVSDTLRQKQHRTVENARLRSISLSQRALTHAGNPVLIGRKQVLLGELSDSGLDRVIWTGLSAWCHSLVSPQVQNWPCWYSPSIQSRSPLDVPCHCSFTQPNSCGHSPFLMETSSWMARLCQELPACFARAEGVSFEAQWQHGRSGCQKSTSWWKQNEDNLPHWAGAVKMVL